MLTHWSAVDLAAPPLAEGIHFVVPFQDEVVQVEVRTLKYDKETRSASKDLQTVETTVTVNYQADGTKVNYLYKEIGLDYENRVIGPAVEETVKQVTANYNAEELIKLLAMKSNQARQAEITTEISEIVGGSEALSDAS